MATRRTRKVSVDGQTKEQLSKEMRQKKGILFIQQFEKEAQARINEMSSKLDQTLATVDRVFKVELMKMPPALQNTPMVDLLDAADISAGEVTIAIKIQDDSLMLQPLKRKPSGKRVKKSDATSKRITAAQKTTVEPAKKATKTRSVPNSSTGNLWCASATAARRTVPRVASVGDPNALITTPRRTATACEDHPSLPAVAFAPHVTISTSQGEVLCLYEETKDEVDVRLLDDIAVLQMERLVKLIQYLTKRADARSSL